MWWIHINNNNWYSGLYLPGNSFITLSIERGNGIADDELLANISNIAKGSTNRKNSQNTRIRIPCAEQSATLKQTHFENNYAGSNGGAIATPNNYKNAFFDILTNTFINNVANSKGGAFHISGH